MYQGSQALALVHPSLVRFAGGESFVSGERRAGRGRVSEGRERDERGTRLELRRGREGLRSPRASVRAKWPLDDLLVLVEIVVLTGLGSRYHRDLILRRPPLPRRESANFRSRRLKDIRYPPSAHPGRLGEHARFSYETFQESSCPRFYGNNDNTISALAVSS